MNTRPCCPPTPTDQACSVGPLSRPYFFAGQCLTEDDLNAMQHYLVERQQRHNRFLHGVGIVNGLKVCSHPCPGWVTITAGFAIGPCGEEICVPEDYAFDLCSAIKKNCMSSAPCADRSEYQWQIRIRYAETECNAMAPVAPKTGKCGCGCQSASPTPVIACQPSRIRECFKIDVVPTDGRHVKTRDELIAGTFAGAVIECSKRYQAVINQIYSLIANQNNSNPIALAPWGLHNEIKSLLSKVACSWQVPSPDPTENTQAYGRRIREYLSNNARLRCICDALLPSLQAMSAPDDRQDLILATVTTNGTHGSPTCEITGICNLRDRQQLIGIPTLQYWTSVVPALWESIEKSCCGSQSSPATFAARSSFLSNSGSIRSDDQLEPLEILSSLVKLLTESVVSQLGQGSTIH
jgi:hypothetical protein